MEGRTQRDLGPHAGGAYHCDSCPLPAADPGPAVRTVFAQHRLLNSGGPRLLDLRWRQLERRYEERPAEIEQLLQDLAAIDDVRAEAFAAQREYEMEQALEMAQNGAR